MKTSTTIYQVLTWQYKYSKEFRERVSAMICSFDEEMQNLGITMLGKDYDVWGWKRRELKESCIRELNTIVLPEFITYTDSPYLNCA